ncbi:hypothetical protein DB41_HY00160 [Neochlamydia sp. TUME1]|nr:hypothetical protein DB41_HY00160 [Neochlamydia sp. TUME1]
MSFRYSNSSIYFVEQHLNYKACLLIGHFPKEKIPSQVLNDFQSIISFFSIQVLPVFGLRFLLLAEGLKDLYSEYKMMGRKIIYHKLPVSKEFLGSLAT